MNACCYEVRFESLFQAGRSLSFPCDTEGHVDLDTLSPKALHNYLFARATVGREYAPPAVWPADLLLADALHQ